MRSRQRGILRDRGEASDACSDAHREADGEAIYQVHDEGAINYVKMATCGSQGSCVSQQSPIAHTATLTYLRS